MSTSAINPKGPRVPKPGFEPVSWADTYLNSTVGMKVLVALTGTGLVGFVVMHLLGNLKLFFGPDEINAYAYFLKHSIGPYIWLARIGLLLIFVAHIALVIRLKTRSAAARPVGYVYQQTAQATIPSQTMLWTGLVILAFLLFHLAHFTFGWVQEVEVKDVKTGVVTRSNLLNLTQTLPDGTERHDVYSMVVYGFRETWLAAFYIVCQSLLAAHLAHGIQSVIQTLGLKGTRWSPIWTGLGYATAGGIFLGNTAIVVAVWVGLVPPLYPLAN